jgi:ribonucleotide monophosphatase NagD (HAD superfamily)
MPPIHELHGILFDMDGVLYNSDRLIAGAADVIAWVKAQGVPHLFLTNTTSRSRAVLFTVLRVSGVALPGAPDRSRDGGTNASRRTRRYVLQSS